MRILTVAVCALLLAGGPALAEPSPERATLLKRLRQAMPMSDENLTLPPVAARGLREDLIAQNPGKEQAISPIAEAFGACFADVFRRRDLRGDAVARADAAGMTNDELRALIAYYENPEWKRLSEAIDAARGSGEPLELTPADKALLGAGVRDPAWARFMALRVEERAETAADEALAKGMMDCGAAARDQIQKAGLIDDPPDLPT